MTVRLSISAKKAASDVSALCNMDTGNKLKKNVKVSENSRKTPERFIWFQLTSFAQ